MPTNYSTKMLLGLMLSGLCSLVAQAEQTVMRDEFAYAAPLTLQGEGPMYSLPIPLTVYRHTTSAALADVRVFNAAGEAVPYVIKPAYATEATQNAPVTLPLFPLYGEDASGMNAVKVFMQSGNATVSVHTRENAVAGNKQAVTAYVLDARKLHDAIQALQLSWPNDAAEFSTLVTVAVSDDLGNWRQVTNAPIANLQFNGQRLLQQRIDMPPTRAKYWRITWPSAVAAVKLTQVQAEPTKNVVEPVPLKLDVPGNAVVDTPHTFDYVLPVHAAVTAFNVQFPERNTYAQVDMYSRRDAKQPWRLLSSQGMYALSGKTPLRNADIAVHDNTDHEWRMVVRGDIGTGAPALQIAWLPHTLTFIARGTLPYELAYGHANVPSSQTPLDALMGNQKMEPGVALMGKPQIVAGPAALVKPNSHAWKTWLLWAVLILAVAVLARIAWGLSREMQASSNDASSSQ